MELKTNIRWMIRRDISEILEIELKNFPNIWTEEDFLRCLRGRNFFNKVAEDYTEKIIGFVIAELFQKKIHILNLAVHPDYRRQTVGEQLVSKVISALERKRHRTHITLEVRETNLAAQQFFFEQGFRAKKVLRNFYEDSDEDAYLMQYDLTDPIW